MSPEPDPLRAMHAEELEAWRLAAITRPEVALLHAGQYCLDHAIAPPRWLQELSTKLAAERLDPKAPKKRGRTAHPRAQREEDLKHYERWATIEEIEERRILIMREIERIQRSPKPSRRALEILHAQLAELGRNKLDAFAAAPSKLEGGAAGSAESIRRSYQRVERDFKDPIRAAKYRLPSRPLSPVKRREQP